MPTTICMPCSAVQKLLDSGAFSGSTLPGGSFCDPNAPATLTATNIHNIGLSYYCGAAGNSDKQQLA